MESLIKHTNYDDDSYEDEDDFDLSDNDNKEEDDKNSGHADLLSSIGASIGKKLNKREECRSEAGLNVSEFYAISNDDRGALPGFRGVKKLKIEEKKKRKQKGKKSKEDELLDELDYDDSSMTKPMKDKAKRSALYENAKKDVSKWNAVVYHNRAADQLVFPLSTGEKITKRTTKDTVSDFVPKTPLEEEMAKILYGEEYVHKKKAELHAKESKTEEEAYYLSREEALEKHNELARLRAIQSYEMAKAKRRNKIKSKKYHRLLRRDKIKKQLKEFEELKQKDPEAALIKLEELDKSRIRERMTLKHRNTSKWAKMQSARAKYNKESRISLSEQLKISKELTQKNINSSDDDSSSSDDMDTDEEIEKLKKNIHDVQDLNVNPKEINIESSGSRRKGKDNYSALASLNLVSVRTSARPIEGEAPLSTTATNKIKSVLLDPKDYLVLHPKSKNPTKNISIDKELLQDEDFCNFDGGDDDQRMIIAEAFEDDDVVADFKKQKADEIEASQPKDINLSLPGWGEWGGTGISTSKKKKRRFVLKAPPAKPRKDANLSHVILNESANAKFKEHQVHEVPFPFQRVKDYEKIIRAPVGRTWLPEKAMKDLTAPKVITRLGEVIKPISEEVLIKNKPVKASGGHVSLLGGIKILK